MSAGVRYVPAEEFRREYIVGLYTEAHCLAGFEPELAAYSSFSTGLGWACRIRARASPRISGKRRHAANAFARVA